MDNMTLREVGSRENVHVTGCSCGHAVGSHKRPTKADDAMECRYCG